MAIKEEQVNDLLDKIDYISIQLELLIIVQILILSFMAFKIIERGKVVQDWW